MKKSVKKVFYVLVPLAVVSGWVLYFHNDAIAAHFSKGGWMQKIVTLFGQRQAAVVAEDEDPDNTKNEIPVHVAHVTKTTLHRYIEGFGTVSPRPAKSGQMAGSANIVSPVAGVVAKVNCQVGQQVHTGDILIQLDDRLAKAAEDQAVAALAQAEASLAALKATPRPDQLQIAQLAVEKAQSAVEFAQKNYDRQKQLASAQVISGKTLEQAQQDLAAAQDDLAVAQKQLAILKSSPTPEDLHQEEAKVGQAAASLQAARMQRQLSAITAPIDGTIASVSVNPGESVDTTRTLVQLVALDRLMVDLDVPADQLPKGAENLSAEILPSSARAGPDKDNVTLAKLAFVSPQVDPHNGTVMVGIDLPPDSALRPGMTVKVRIIAEQHEDCLAVPREAVVADENGDQVIAVVDGEQATHKTVKIGLEENGLIEIIADGIKEGTTVVTAGAFGLPQATHVKVME